MAVSEKQLRANRQNAQKSTGPKSVEGKAIASRNGTKYGLYSQDLIITSANLKENQEEYDRLLTSLLGELLPQTGMQLYLVHKIAGRLWRSRRAVRAETAVVTRQLDHIDDDIDLRNRFMHVVRQVDGREEECDNDSDEAREEEARYREIEVGRQSIPNDRFAVNILRYEMRLDRQLTRAYKLLCQLQDRQDRNQTESDGPVEIPVPVYRCPAVYGDECVQHRPAPDTHPPNTVDQDSGAPSAAADCGKIGRPTPPEADGRENLAGAHPPRRAVGSVEKIRPTEPESQSWRPQHSPVNTPEEGFERPTVDMPTDDPVSEEDHNQAPSDTVESRHREARRPGPGRGRSTHQNTKNDKPNPFPGNESVAAGLSRQGPPEADDLPPVNRGDGITKSIKNNKPNPFPRNRKRDMQVQRKMAGFPEVNQR